MSICTLCLKDYNTADLIMEQLLVGDTQFCNLCFTEFMSEDVGNIFF
jgi:hypothetical protein